MNLRRLPETHASEQELRASVLPRLRRWFKVHEEVRGTHYTGKSLRIDAILEPLDPTGWKDEAPALGIELKMPRGFDTRDYTRWMAQSVDYTHVNWYGFGRVPIFTCPSPAEQLAVYGESATNLMTRMLGQLGVGELVRLERYGWALLLNEHRLWSEREGVAEARRWSVKPKTGSR